MTPVDQRIAIAESVGWKCDWEALRINLEYFKGRDGYPDAIFALAPIPDYLGDLNAMAKVEKTLNEYQRSEYACRLSSKFSHGFNFFTAPAHDRAEAYLKTLCLWKPVVDKPSQPC